MKCRRGRKDVGEYCILCFPKRPFFFRLYRLGLLTFMHFLYRLDLLLFIVSKSEQSRTSFILVVQLTEWREHHCYALAKLSYF